MLPDNSGDDLQIGFEGTDGPFLVLPHEATVALDIGTQDGGEFSFYLIWGHKITSPWIGMVGSQK
jgi:hypothetical protein